MNLLNYDFAEFGYKVRSIPHWLYGLFLSYKIERPVLQENDSDTRFSLNAISETPVPTCDLDLVLDEPKLAYLRRRKAGSLKRANFERLSSEDISRQIRAKLTGSYFHNLARASDGATLKFNVIIENGSARNVCALEYRPEDRALRVITFY